MDATLCMYVGVGGGEAMILGKGNRFLRGSLWLGIRKEMRRVLKVVSQLHKYYGWIEQ